MTSCCQTKERIWSKKDRGTRRGMWGSCQENFQKRMLSSGIRVFPNVCEYFVNRGRKVRKQAISQAQMRNLHEDTWFVISENCENVFSSPLKIWGGWNIRYHPQYFSSEMRPPRPQWSTPMLGTLSNSHTYSLSGALILTPDCCHGYGNDHTSWLQTELWNHCIAQYRCADSVLSILSTIFYIVYDNNAR